MTKCKKCGSVAVFEEEYCKEHYYELYKIPLDFHKFKERKWRDFLRYCLLADWHLHVSYDKQLDGTKIKPDIHFFFLDSVFIIEIDEHQHKLNIAYEEDREQARYNQLSIFQDIQVFRINTDQNKDRPAIFKKTVKVHTPGEITCDIETNQVEFQFRQDEVKRALYGSLLDKVENYKTKSKYFQGYKTTLQIHYLFYD